MCTLCCIHINQNETNGFDVIVHLRRPLFRLSKQCNKILLQNCKLTLAMHCTQKKMFDFFLFRFILLAALSWWARQAHLVGSVLHNTWYYHTCLRVFDAGKSRGGNNDGVISIWSKWFCFVENRAVWNRFIVLLDTPGRCSTHHCRSKYDGNLVMVAHNIKSINLSFKMKNTPLDYHAYFWLESSGAL